MTEENQETGEKKIWTNPVQCFCIAFAVIVPGAFLIEMKAICIRQIGVFRVVIQLSDRLCADPCLAQ